MDDYERETRRMELENARQARIDALPWHRKLGRWWSIVWLPFLAGAVLIAVLWALAVLVAQGS